MIGDQPACAIAAPTFLVGGERDDDVAVGNLPLLLQLDDVRDPDSGLRFVVRRAASVEVPVAFGKLEWLEIGRPVRLERFDHVEMRKQQQWLRPVRAAAAGLAEHDVVLVGPYAAQENVAIRESGVPEPLGHRLRRGGCPHRVCRRVRLYEFLIGVARQLLVGRQRCLLRD